ncbi:MAG: flagellar motor protein [Alistipes senegalensis]|nr:flagellar motor protein [Oxalobacter formigenes]MCM1281819.1 flagellar motor protein [Alistipes senegalensis]
MDWGSIAGLILGIGGIAAGQVMEGGHIASLLQPAAFVIVFVGTVGAVVLQSGFSVFWRGFKRGRLVFFPGEDDYPQMQADIGRWSMMVWREGPLVLEGQVNQTAHPFMRAGLRYVSDNIEPAKLRSLLETEIQVFEESERRLIRIWEAAGGYSPTIGILGAVLGLIHVMENLSDPARLGSGIAIAFVATIYGVGLANLVFLPIGNRLKAWLAREVAKREMLLEAFHGILTGENPRVITERMALLLSGR